MRTKLTIAAILLAGAVAYLAFAGAREGWVYYVDVDRFVEDGRLQSQRVRLHGEVAKTDFYASAGEMTARFVLLGKQANLPVSYAGTIPDMFDAGVNVVVEGKMNAAGTFEADLLMTKCASKYEPGMPEGMGQGKTAAMVLPSSQEK
jgi:cytochrome c-type biogenesis protein CcmE